MVGRKTYSLHDRGIRMNNKKRALTFLGILAGLAVIFAITVYLAGTMLGTRQSLVPGGAVGLLEVKGVLIDADEIIRQLKELRDDDGVKAIVLRVDSPGGVVGPSQEIYEEVKKVATEKKVIASFGSVAASGGYYIAAPATRIYANPGTITGSIGVILKFSNIEGLLGKIGLKALSVKSGEHKDIGSSTRPMTEADRAILQGVIDSIHSQFVKAVAEGRKLPVEEVKSLADGRIFTGEQALQYKLVDVIGNKEDAIAEAARIAGIKGEPRIIKPTKKKVSMWDFFVGGGESRLAGFLQGKTGFSANYELDGPDLLLMHR